MDRLLLGIFAFFILNCYDSVSTHQDHRPQQLHKPHHPTPSYFRWTDKDGNFVDRASPEYDSKIPQPMVIRISKLDAETASLKVTPLVVDNEGTITVSWSGVQGPVKKDFIALYCPKDDKPQHYLDYFFVSSKSSTWSKGYGSVQLTVYNMRTQCQFMYYRANEYSQLVAKSNELQFTGGPAQPLQGRLALTGNPSQMRVMWTSAEVNHPIVKYGVSKDKLAIESTGTSKTYKASDMCGPPANTTGFWDPGYIYDALLENLEPHTTYFYSFGSEKVMSPVYNFTTALAPGDPKPFKFVAYGDMGVSAFPRATETRDLMLREIRDNNIKLIFHNGDISYARGQAYIWEQWHALIEPYSTLIPYMIGMGNHEQDHTTGGSKDPSGAPGEGYHPSWGNMGDDSDGECGLPMFRRFHMPDNGNAVWWHSYDYGMVHFIMMSTEHDFSPNSRQYNWLENDLKNVDRKKTPWVVIGGHRSMYMSEAYMSDYKVSTYMQKLFEDLLYKYGVDLAFWAHNHSYERVCKVYKQECKDDGIVHIVIGTAGMTVDSNVWLKKPWSMYHENTYGYGRVTVANSSSLLFEFIRNKDQVVRDKVWLHK